VAGGVGGWVAVGSIYREVTVELPTMEERMARLLTLIAEGRRRCRFCGAELFTVRHSANGDSWGVYTVDGLRHFDGGSCSRGVK
jgi:hypothetical protein